MAGVDKEFWVGAQSTGASSGRKASGRRQNWNMLSSVEVKMNVNDFN